MKNPNRRLGAFTLVEVLIVGVIIALILIMALPAMKKIWEAKTTEQAAPPK
jgi:Tfp pilus assembly protein FimT